MKAVTAFLSTLLISYTVLAETAVCTLVFGNQADSPKLIDLTVGKVKLEFNNSVGPVKFYKPVDSTMVQVEGVNNNPTKSPLVPNQPFTMHMTGQFTKNMANSETNLKIDIRTLWGGYPKWTSSLGSATVPAKPGKFSFSVDGIKLKNPPNNSERLTAFCEIYPAISGSVVKTSSQSLLCFQEEEEIPCLFMYSNGECRLLGSDKIPLQYTVGMEQSFCQAVGN